MGDDSSRSILKSLRNEWSLFLEVFQGDSETEESENDNLLESEPELLDLDRVRELTRLLLEDRRRLNQRLESLSKEIDLNSAKLESLRLVGGEAEPIISRLNELTDLGQGIATAMSKLDHKLREFRERENELREEMIS